MGDWGCSARNLSFCFLNASSCLFASFSSWVTGVCTCSWWSFIWVCCSFVILIVLPDMCAALLCTPALAIIAYQTCQSTGSCTSYLGNDKRGGCVILDFVWVRR